jgi:ATP-dependent RNA helicase RhlE
MSFTNLKLIEPIQNALKSQGYTTPTPVQQKAIPVILEGNDLIACAQTGTGKTAAFALPLIQMIHNNPQSVDGKRNIQALIVTPTRELAVQIGENFEAYAGYTDIKHALIYGGVPKHYQVEALKRGIDVLVVTPGRLMDLMTEHYIDFRGLQTLVLDEADRMLDMGFIDDIKQIIGALPDKRQTLLFSATMPAEIVKLATKIMHKPFRIEITPPASTVELIDQSVYIVDQRDKKDLLVHLLKEKTIQNALVFTRTKFGADKISQYLTRSGIKSEAFHSDKSQEYRQKTLNDFKDKKIRVLIATDIAARGIDIDGLSHVINFEIPDSPETYVHRIGRTGRAGAYGKSLSFCDNKEIPNLMRINKLIDKWIPEVENHPFY